MQFDSAGYPVGTANQNRQACAAGSSPTPRYTLQDAITALENRTSATHDVVSQLYHTLGPVLSLAPLPLQGGQTNGVEVTKQLDDSRLADRLERLLKVMASLEQRLLELGQRVEL